MKMLKTIKQLMENANIAKGKLEEEYVFTVAACNLFYFKNNIGLSDIKAGFTDGANDGGIDFICTVDGTMHLIQGKSSKNLSVEDIKNVFYKMKETTENILQERDEKYSIELRSSFLNSYGDTSESKDIEFVLFTNTEVNDKMSKEIHDFVQKPEFNNYSLVVYDCNDINNKEISIEDDFDLVEEGKLELFDDIANNFLRYGEKELLLISKPLH